MATRLENKVQILSVFQSEFEEDPRFGEFIAQRNIGFPIAYLITEDLVTTITSSGEKWINSAFQDLLDLFKLKDSGWNDWWEIQESVGVEPDYDLPEGSVWELEPSSQGHQDGGESTRFCTECGNRIEEDAKFCSGCGSQATHS